MLCQSTLVYLQWKASPVTVVCARQVVGCMECLQLLQKQLVVVLLVQWVQQVLLVALLMVPAAKTGVAGATSAVVDMPGLTVSR